MAITPETRIYRNFEMRAGDQDGFHVEGYAALFEQETVLYEEKGIQYKEVIDRNAFQKTLMQDVVMNFNHHGKPVARTKNGTLILTIDQTGLQIAADLSGTEEGRRLYEEIRGGYLDKMSFSFYATPGEYDRTRHLRRITEVVQLFDVAAVDIPAYQNTTISARSFFLAEAEREQTEVLERRRKRLKLQLLLEE